MQGIRGAQAVGGAQLGGAPCDGAVDIDDGEVWILEEVCLVPIGKVSPVAAYGEHGNLHQRDHGGDGANASGSERVENRLDNRSIGGRGFELIDDGHRIDGHERASGYVFDESRRSVHASRSSWM